ncbi:MAG: DNA-binding protein [Alphaproteobacteria bacterium]
MAQDKATFQALATSRLAEAKVLAERSHPSGAYYLAGYAVECALKAIIAGQFRAHEIPDRVLVNKVYTHNLPELLRLAGLQDELEERERDTPILKQRWATVETWSEASRYAIWSDEVAAALLDAIDGDENGIFRWLTSLW